MQIVDRGPNHIHLEVSTPVEGYLYVGEMWLPGWQAEVDGEPREVLKANYTFRAVHVPAGEHQVSMTYRPRSWSVGLALTLVTLAVLAAWGLWSLWGALKRARRQAEP